MAGRKIYLELDQVNSESLLSIFWALFCSADLREIYVWRGSEEQIKKKKYLAKGREGKWERYLEEEKIWSTQERKNEEGKGGKYLEKGNIWSTEEKKNGHGKGGKYLDKENIERRKIFGSAEEMKNREGKGGNYSEKENWCWRRQTDQRGGYSAICLFEC